MKKIVNILGIITTLCVSCRNDNQVDKEAEVATDTISYNYIGKNGNVEYEVVEIEKNGMHKYLVYNNSNKLKTEIAGVYTSNKLKHIYDNDTVLTHIFKKDTSLFFGKLAGPFLNNFTLFGGSKKYPISHLDTTLTIYKFYENTLPEQDGLIVSFYEPSVGFFLYKNTSTNTYMYMGNYFSKKNNLKSDILTQLKSLWLNDSTFFEIYPKPVVLKKSNG